MSIFPHLLNHRAIFPRILSTDSLCFGRLFLSCISADTNKAKRHEVIADNPLERMSVQDLEFKYKPRLAGRKYLPGSKDGGFPEFLSGPKEGFPLAYKLAPNTGLDMLKCGQLYRTIIDRDLPEYFAILFRGLPLQSATDFSQFLKCVGYQSTDEGVTGYRTPVASNVDTASDDPKEFSMELHTDGAYYSSYPRKVFLFCAHAPEIGAGGEAVIAKTREVADCLDFNVKHKFDELGVRYQGFLPNKGNENKKILVKAWHDRYLTDNRKKVEEILISRKQNFSWDENLTLRYWYNYPAFLFHPDTGEKLWYNQITSGHASYYKANPIYEGVTIPDDCYPFHCYYGNGSEIEPSTLQHIRATGWSCAVGFTWQTSDVLVLDNVLALHGRMSWTGERQMFVSQTLN